MPDSTQLPPDLQELVVEARNRNHGFFGPASYAWRILRENTIQLAGPYAALMQVAHPHVAQGVHDHSAYDTDPTGRLKRTFKAVHKIVFGSVDDAIEAAMHSRRMHKPVHGTTPGDAGPFKAGSHYHANRVDLLLWVHATLIEGAILGHERFIAPLPTDEKFRLYEEFKVFGRLFGIPLDKYPATYADFSGYYAAMIRNQLAVSPAGREIANNIIWNSPFKPAGPVILLLGSGMLPPNVREGFGLPWNRAMALALEQFSKGYRQSRQVLPKQILYRSAYLRGIKRTNAPLPPRSGSRLHRLLDGAF